MLTPLSARMRTLAETMAPDEYAEAMAQLTPCKILFALLTLHLHRDLVHCALQVRVVHNLWTKHNSSHLTSLSLFLSAFLMYTFTVRQSVRDLQGMLVFDVHRIFGLAKAMVKGNHQNTNVSSQLSVILGSPVASGLLELKQINSLGDLYIRERFWEESLEVTFRGDPCIHHTIQS